MITSNNISMVSCLHVFIGSELLNAYWENLKIRMSDQPVQFLMSFLISDFANKRSSFSAQ